MNELASSFGCRSRWLWVVALVLLVGAAALYALGVIGDRGKTPRPLNDATEAREVRPFSEKPDKRFAPLPFEKEEHEK